MLKHNISTEILSLRTKELVSRQNFLSSATKRGLTVCIKKKSFLIPEQDLPKILNHPVQLFLDQYEIAVYGVITKIRVIKEDLFEISIGFTKETPLYYRECVGDLLN